MPGYVLGKEDGVKMRKGSAEWEVLQAEPIAEYDYPEIRELMLSIRDRCWLDIWAANHYGNLVEQIFVLVRNSESFKGRLADVHYTADGTDIGIKTYLHILGLPYYLQEHVIVQIMKMNRTPRPSNPDVKRFPLMRSVHRLSADEIRISDWHFGFWTLRLGVVTSEPGGISIPRRQEMRDNGQPIPKNKGTYGRAIVKRRLADDKFHAMYGGGMFGS